jgi:hypothetical protein
MGTPLAFAGVKKPDLLFCSHMDQRLPRNTRRVLGSSLMLQALNPGRKDMDVLAIDYNRVLTFGRMDLRLLPAGLSPGAAMLEINYNNATIIYCNALELAHPVAGEKAADVKCDMLLLDTPVSQIKSPAPSTVKRQFLKWVDSLDRSAGAAAVICARRSDVFNITASLSNNKIQVYAHRTVFEMLRNTGYLAVGGGDVSKLGSKWPAEGLVLLPQKAWNSTQKWKSIVSGVCAAGEGCTGGGIDAEFIFAEARTEKELVAFAKSTGTEIVALGSGFTPSNAAVFKKAGFKVYYSRKPIQLPLPF